jgi:hypothetical protein
MVCVMMGNAFVMKDGVELCVVLNCAQIAVLNTANVLMELAYVMLGTRVKIVPY